MQAPEPLHGLRAEVDVLAREIDAVRPKIAKGSPASRTAQVAAWAGRARALQDVLPTDEDPSADRLQAALRGVFGRLTAITRETECGWVDALSPDWTMDWNVYVSIHEAAVWGETVDLSPEQEMDYQRAILRGLVNPRRQLNDSEAATAAYEAAEILPPDDPDLLAAFKRIGIPSPARRSVHPSGKSVGRKPEPSRREVSLDVLALTRGKRALMVGGQGVRPEHERAIRESFQLAEFEWPVSERGQVSQFNRLAERIRPGRYDLVLFLASFSSHKSAAFVRACKDAGISLVYITRGYSISSIELAIQDQLKR